MAAYGTMPGGVSFRGASDDVGERARALTGPPLQQTKGGTQETPMAVALKPRNFFIIIGVLALSLVVVIPVADAYQLLESPTFLFFVGHDWPRAVIMLSCFSLLFYMAAVASLFAFAGPEGKTDVSLFMIASIVVTILGLSMVLISGPLRVDTETAIGHLFNNCPYGASTQRLYEVATELQGLRSLPGCIDKQSVAECDGYQEAMPYTGLLRGMEMQYKCAGFCYNATMVAASAATFAAKPLPPLPVAAIERLEEGELRKPELPKVGRVPAQELRGAVAGASSEREQQRRPPKVSMLDEKGGLLIGALQQYVATHAETQAAFLQVQSMVPDPFVTNQTMIGYIDGRSPADEPGRTTFYPLPLFNRIAYQTSCDGMAMRELRYQGVESSRILFYGGTCLMFAAVVGGLLKICNLCTLPRKTGQLSRKLGVLYT